MTHIRIGNQPYDIARTVGLDNLEANLATYCSAAMTFLGQEIEREVRSWSFDVVHMTSGQCEMLAHGGTEADELSNGAWTMTIHVGHADEVVQAPFRGERLP